MFSLLKKLLGEKKSFDFFLSVSYKGNLYSSVRELVIGVTTSKVIKVMPGFNTKTKVHLGEMNHSPHSH